MLKAEIPGKRYRRQTKHSYLSVSVDLNSDDETQVFLEAQKNLLYALAIGQ